MQVGLCHYSLRKTWQNEGWDSRRFLQEAARLGARGIDLQAGMLKDLAAERRAIREAARETGIALVVLAIPKDLHMDCDEDIEIEARKTEKWLQFAAEVSAPMARVFGDYGREGEDESSYQAKLRRAHDYLGRVIPIAERLGIVLVLENRGRLPWTAEYHEQVIRKFSSPYLEACVDIGNYRECGQSPEAATAVMAPLAAYVQFKDYWVQPDFSAPKGWRTKACALGDGEAKLEQCVRVLKESGYSDFVAVEYEGEEPESTAVPRSVKVLCELVSKAG